MTLPSNGARTDGPAPTRRPGELWFACALLAFSLAALWQAYGISGFSSPFGPGVFPMLAAGTMCLASLAIAVATALRPAPQSGGLNAFFAEALPGRLLVFLGFVTAFLVAMPWLGFMPAAALFLYGATAVLWRKGFLRPLLIAVPAMVLVWITFRVLFDIILPRGVILPNLL